MTCIDADGRAVAGVSVTANQMRSAFHFGMAFTNTGGQRERMGKSTVASLMMGRARAIATNRMIAQAA